MKPIFTSSWFVKLPADHIRIGISRSVPRHIGPGFKRIKSLQPGPWLDAEPVEFCRLYQHQLDHLDPEATVARIFELSGDRVPVLVCYEAPDPAAAWCHRGQVSAWLFDRLGLEVREYGLEGCGCGWHHPKLHQAKLEGT